MNMTVGLVTTFTLIFIVLFVILRPFTWLKEKIEEKPGLRFLLTPLLLFPIIPLLGAAVGLKGMFERYIDHGEAQMVLVSSLIIFFISLYPFGWAMGVSLKHDKEEEEREAKKWPCTTPDEIRACYEHELEKANHQWDKLIKKS